MANWFEILKSVSDEKFQTAKEIGVAAQSLTALVRRGYVEKTNTSPAKYKRTEKAIYYLNAFNYINKHPNKDFYTFYKSTENLGMLCSVKGNDILDCYDNIWDLTNLEGVMEGLKRIPF